jgi:GNAT superfamily N-acetyltransferase
MEYIDIAMIRENLDDIPQFRLAPPYSARWYQPGDEETWRRIQMASDKYGSFPPDKFGREFGHEANILKERQCYLCDAEGRPFGTTTAWFNDDYHGRPHGRVHWVAVVPEMQGKGLARPMMTIICNRLRELGHERAYLTTANVRIPALNLYLKFGFVPDIRTARDLAAWRGVRHWIRPAYWERAFAAVPELA